jgi:hypothetical protein
MLPLDGFDDKSGEVSELPQCLLFACLTNEGLIVELVDVGNDLSLNLTGIPVSPPDPDFSDNGENDCRVVVVESVGLHDA